MRIPTFLRFLVIITLLVTLDLVKHPVNLPTQLRRSRLDQSSFFLFEAIAFCFSDLQPPELNAKIYEQAVPRLLPGGLLVIDNVTSPRLQSELIKRAENDPRVDSVLLPFPKGDLVCRKAE